MFLFHTFKTSNNKYIYDSSTNNIIKIDENTYSYLNSLTKIELVNDTTPGFLEATKTLRSNGYLIPANFDLENPLSFYVKDMLHSGMSTMILQLTMQCNMRCKYCFYSDKYPQTDNYSNTTMSYKVIKESLDFFIEHSYSCPQKTLGFYGGEPLLEVDKIYFAINYIKEHCKNSNINFSITTNATLLNEEIIDFLVKNNFILQLSLDGPANVHDKNRLLKNAKGTYEIVLDKIKYLFCNYPDYCEKNVSINAVFDHSESYNYIFNYFSNSPIFSKMYWKITYINDYIKNNICINKNLKTTNNAQFKSKQVAYFYNKIKSKEFIENKTYQDLFDYNSIENKLSQTYNGFPVSLSKGGLCVPGITRLLVTPEGNFRVCEKTTTNDIYTIGNVFSGFNSEKIRKLMNADIIAKNKCKNCWAIRLCDICVAKIDFSSPDYNSHLDELCIKTRNRISKSLNNLCLLQELMVKENTNEKVDSLPV